MLAGETPSHVDLAKKLNKDLIFASFQILIISDSPDADKNEYFVVPFKEICMLSIFLEITRYKWETKDYITLISSAIAICFSLITFLQKILEQNRGLRKQLTDTLEKITALNLESEKSKANAMNLPSNYQSLLNDQRHFFVRQAGYIAKKIKRLVSPYEWVIIAWGWARIDELEEAIDFFQIAVQRSKSSIEKGLSNRSYASFLLNERQEFFGNEYFQDAINDFVGDSDRMINYRATTYERWARSLSKINSVEASAKWQRAILEWKKHSNEERRKAELSRLTTVVENQIIPQMKHKLQ